MEFNIPQFSALAEAKKKYDELVVSVGKDAILAAVRQFMDAHPEVTGIQWDQYTPYYSDGDACHFGVCEPKVRLKQDIDELDADADFDYLWGDENRKKYPTLSGDIGDLEELLRDSEDSLLIAFGDHVTVTVTKDGIEIDDCEHD